MTPSTKKSSMIADRCPLQILQGEDQTAVVVVPGDAPPLLVLVKHMELVGLADGAKLAHNQSMDDIIETSSFMSSDDSTLDSSSASSTEDYTVVLGRKITTTTDPKSGLMGECVIQSGHLQPQEERCRRHRRIHFNPAVQLRRHFALHEYTKKELNACWFRGEENAEITRSCHKLITMLEQQDCQEHDAIITHHHHDHDRREDEEEYCFRGLESHTRLAALAKNQNRRVAWDAVLDEQCDQVFLGVLDEEAIARRYRDASSSCQLWAIRVAQQDQRVAEFESEDDVRLLLD